MNVVCIWEGLGNQMFQYAFAKSLEIHTGRRVYIDAESLRGKKIGEEQGASTLREYGLSNFKISLKQVGKAQRRLWNYTQKDKWYHEIIEALMENNKYPYKYFSQKGFNDISVPTPSLLEIEKNTYLKGWFQSEKYFADIRSIILKEFEPLQEIAFSKDLVETIAGTDSVSVHIRRGDFKKTKIMLDQSYYVAAMEAVKSKISAPVWIVFSDDIPYVKEKYPFGQNTIFIDDTYKLKDYEQLILMSKCKHNIIANSTFSWWGAWLNRHEDCCVIAPRKWFSSQGNIVPDSWTKI